MIKKIGRNNFGAQGGKLGSFFFNLGYLCLNLQQKLLKNCFKLHQKLGIILKHLGRFCKKKSIGWEDGQFLIKAKKIEASLGKIGK